MSHLSDHAAANSETDKFKRTKSMNFDALNDKSPKIKPLESSFENLTKKSLEINYAKFNAFFSKFKNKRLIAKLFLAPVPSDGKGSKSTKNQTENSKLLSTSMSKLFSASDFKKTRRLLKTYMSRKTRQKIIRLRLKKRRRQLAKQKEERIRQDALKKKLNSVKFLQYLIENSNNSNLKK